MKRILTGTVAAWAVAFLMQAQVGAGPVRPTLNWGSMVNAGMCNTGGSPVINVTMKLLNDADSGQAGNYWGMDTFNKTIQVWPQVDGTYCAVVKYTGKFVGAAGQTSPGALGVLTGMEKGTVEGGYVATIDGALRATPLWKTRGNVGTIDLNCDLAGHCPGGIDWVGQYFSSYTFDYQWWGWVYHGDHNTWVNSSDGNAGDIIK